METKEKHSWKVEEKEWYVAKSKPAWVTIPKFRFFTIAAPSRPEEKEWKAAMEVLLRFSKFIHQMPKRGFFPGGYYPYVVYPMEFEKQGDQAQLMVRQPSFVTESIARMTVTGLTSTNRHPLLQQVHMREKEDGRCIQVGVTGMEQWKEAWQALEAQAEKEGVLLSTDRYRVIALNDWVKTAPEKRKMTLRRFVVESE